METCQETYKGYSISVMFDENPESPREWENIGIIHCAHRRYSLGDVQHNTLEAINAAENKCLKNGDIVLPLYLYDHSGITISLSPFSCPWDSGRVGFIAIPRKKMLKEFSAKIFSKKLKEKALEIAKEEIEVYDQFLRGEVYGYVVRKDSEELESCWGHYGLDYCKEEAKKVVDYLQENN